MPQETTLTARQVGGRHLAPESPLWRTLFPSDLLRIEGRVPVDNSSKYLLQMRLNATKELIATAFRPASEASENNFKIFSDFLISKRCVQYGGKIFLFVIDAHDVICSRHGLVFPWGSRPKEYHPGRELYMIPLLQSEPLPEYMELLDELKLPKIRTSDYIVGIWILNKGKLAPLPVHPISQGQQPPLPAFATTSTNAPTYPTPPPLTQSPPVPPSLSGLPIPPAVVAEVASLTPEQIQNVIQTLASTTRLPFSQTPVWGNQQAAFPNFPPQNPVQAYQSPPHGMNPPHSLGSPHSQSHAITTTPYEQRQDYSREFRGSSYDGEPGGRGEQGWRGNNRGRGARGRGARGDGFDSAVRRPVDSGWPRRPKNEGPAGGPSW